MDYLNNAWYVCAASSEVGRTTLRRVLLDRPCVMYRTQAGEPVALLDRCPHRFAPLSAGTLVGDDIQCRYHGLRFSPRGECVHNPHGGQAPRGASVHALPVVERFGFVWVWMGRPELADAALLPDLRPYGAPDTRSRWGSISIAADYRLVIDNLLDLSHVEFLHPSFTSEGSLDTTTHDVLEQDNVVSSNRWKRDCAISPMLSRVWNRPGARGDSRSCIRWYPPSNLFLEIGATDTGAAHAQGVTVHLLHLLTPESAGRTHYFWAVAWPAAQDTPGMDAWLEAVLVEAFEKEDEPMIAAQQANIGTGVDLMSLGPALLKTDVAVVKARRILSRLVQEERSAAVGNAPPLRALGET